jgi:hypothetical protein
MTLVTNKWVLTKDIGDQYCGHGKRQRTLVTNKWVMTLVARKKILRKEQMTLVAN